MNNTAVLNSRDEENLVRAIQFSLPIRRRNQFFLWSQGILQGLIPHEVLFCAYGAPACKPFVTDKYTTRPFPEALYSEICNSPEGLLAASHAAWEQGGHTPLLICPERGHAWLNDRFGELLKRHDLVNCAVHGVPPFNGGAGSFFCFARMPGPLSPRHAYLLEVILPYLHVAYVRTLMNEGDLPEQKNVRPISVPVTSTLSRAVTGREIQILQWMHEGKSNREIGEILTISEFTVKNHVQNVLKKLHVRNRTQAVSCALSLRLISSQGPRSQ
ncbi:MAG TPA: XrtB/PEP-CTERM-associated transcriptional regulator EpsA [Burkholderiales bacterium]|jgi:transcriptional regulator EpsA|nr:XrtB/PEP-CTERM-associated transcriptional regulator EpsA [Burkholderiales bacterium]